MYIDKPCITKNNPDLENGMRFCFLLLIALSQIAGAVTAPYQHPVSAVNDSSDGLAGQFDILSPRH
jgi:hypothetical protein